MTEFYQIVSMSRPFRTLNCRVILDPTLRNLSERGGVLPLVATPGFLYGVIKIQPLEAVKNQSDIA